MPAEIEIRELTALECRQHLPALAAVLVDCVAGGASVNFMAGFTQAEAEAFFAKVLDGVERHDRVLLAAFLGENLVGTVQIVPAPYPNQPHRAEIAKLLVHRSARGRGVAAKLMQEVEVVAQRLGRTLLVLDTVTGEAGDRLYRRMGWTEAGVIPDFCLFPDGRLCSTTIFWKRVQAE